jgi:hypothetical protein
VTAEWYYIGHYGQLGPLTREQIDELIEGGVIASETYVWRAGMTDWLPANRMPDLQPSFTRANPYNAPPPPPDPRLKSTAPPPQMSPFSYEQTPVNPMSGYPTYAAPRSDKSRTAGGVLQLLIPGVGRMYLGYPAFGVLQLILAPCGVGWLWSIIDGVIILAGGVRMDGYGRQLND